MDVLIFCSVYSPGYKAGGPVRSLLNLVDCLGSEARFSIVTGDRDCSDTFPYSSSLFNRWVRKDKASVIYLSPGFLRLIRIAQILFRLPRRVLYLNSLFDPVFSLYPLFLRRIGIGSSYPIILAPRGELSPGALAFKSYKKYLLLTIANCFHLYRDVIWHATSLDEAQNIKNRFGSSATIHIAPNIPTPIPDFITHPRHTCSPVRPLRLIFLSRLHPKKNIDFALRVLSLVHTSVDFFVYGPDQDSSYVNRCRELADHLPTHIRVYWRGDVPPAQVSMVLAAHDLFFLPTRGENYGHVIAESLSAGTPVLISDTTPWRDLSSAGVGWDLPLTDTAAFAACIHLFSTLSSEEYLAYRKRAHQFAMNKLQLPCILDAHRTLFSTANRLFPDLDA